MWTGKEKESVIAIQSTNESYSAYLKWFIQPTSNDSDLPHLSDLDHL